VIEAFDVAGDFLQQAVPMLGEFLADTAETAATPQRRRPARWRSPAAPRGGRLCGAGFAGVQTQRYLAAARSSSCRLSRSWTAPTTRLRWIDCTSRSAQCSPVTQSFSRAPLTGAVWLATTPARVRCRRGTLPTARSSPGTTIASLEPGRPGDALGERAVQARDITGSTLITGDHVTVLHGAPTAFDNSTAAQWVEATRRAGDARRRLSRERLGLTPAQVDASFAVEDALPDALRDLDRGEVRVLTGPLGAGKSDLAERWLLTSADVYEGSSGATAIPVWASATTVDRPLQEHVLHLLGRPDVLSSTGVDLVVDGLDEQPGAAAPLVEQARVLVATSPRSRVVMAARAGVAVPDSMALPVTEWERDAALQLIAAVTGTTQHQHIDHRWPEALGRTIRRPFFALLAAAHMSDPSMPRTGAGLIDRAVRQALGDSAPTGALRALAAERVRTGRPVDLHAQFPDEAVALLGSRLLVVDQGRAVFALPIFEQWFAAQALLRGEADVGEALAHMSAFARWRYALAVAVASGQTSQVDRLMHAVARWNPGAASWLVNEAISTRLSPEADLQPLEDWTTVGTSIRAATGAWLAGLGPASQLVGPVRWLPGEGTDPLSAATLAVAVEDGRISQGWTGAARVPGPVAYGPPGVFEPAGYPYDWCGLRSGVPAPSPNWVWRWTLDALRSDLEQTLMFDVERRAPSSGVIAREWVYSRAQALLESHLRPRTWETILQRLSEMRERASGADNISFRVGLVTFDSEDLERMHRLIDSSASAAVAK